MCRDLKSLYFRKEVSMKYYFSGIGGIGMSSLALYLAYKHGITSVLGSNNEMNERVEYLIKKGIKVKIKSGLKSS